MVMWNICIGKQEERIEEKREEAWERAMVREMKKNKAVTHVYEDGIMKHITFTLTLN